MRVHGVALTVCCSCFLVATGASATDLYVRPGLKDAPYIPPAVWPGFYIGGHAGAAWNTDTANDHYDYIGDPEASNHITGVGAIAGGQAGYNFQWGNIVFGPEGDLGYLGLAGRESAALPTSPDCTVNHKPNQCGLNALYSNSGGLYGDIAGRLGYAAGPLLFYAKGGFALLDAGIKANYSGDNCTTAHACYPSAPVKYSTFSFDRSATLSGWTAGAGVEYAFSPTWSVKLEYLHFDFDSMSITHDGRYNITGTPYHSTLSGTVEASPTVDSLMLGVNYHLNLASALK